MTEDGCDSSMVEGVVVIDGSPTDGEKNAKTTSPASSTVFFFFFQDSLLCFGFSGAVALLLFFCGGS